MDIPGEFRKQIGIAIRQLTSQNGVFLQGLSDMEVERTENSFGFRFPSDLRALLQAGLPSRIDASGREQFPNWRSGEASDLHGRLDWPFESMAFDIENNAFWMEEWGIKPGDLRDAIGTAKRHVNEAPRLIPIFSHRYLPSEPPLAGNPVLSVHQTDIIFYGRDLWNYLKNEFAPGSKELYWRNSKIDEFRKIRFWSDLVG
jgi:hypothetical protein